MANSIIVRGNKAITKPDAAHQLTEQKLTQLERQIGKTYAEATRDIERTIAKYWAGLDKREAEQIRRLKAGQITPAQFRQWKINQVGRGERLEAMRDDLAERVYNVNVVANAYINDTTAGIYSLNRNYIGYTISKYYPQAAFTIYDEQTVKRLVMAKPDVMPYYPKARAIRRGIDIDYGKKIITNTITSSILQGRTIKQIAGDLQSRLINMERDSAVRAARTAYTGAQNAGRLAGMEAAQKQGINIQKQWLSTSDARTRDSHAMIDGEIKDINKPFSNGLMYPADRDGAPAEVYNCRCTLLYVVDGKSVLNGGDIYNAPKLESWIKENATPISLTDAGKVLTAPTPKPPTIANPNKYKFDTHDDIVKFLKKNIGFEDVEDSLKELDRDLFIKNIKQLEKLEKKFGVIKKTSVSFCAEESGGEWAYVSRSTLTPNKQELALNSSYYKDKASLIEELEDAVRTKWHMPCSKSNYDVYTVTHEYGHMLQNMFITDAYKNDGWNENSPLAKVDRKKQTDKARYKWYNNHIDKVEQDFIKEIEEIAKKSNPNFDLDSNISKYGKSDPAEFFAEVFANSQCGEPNELGKAMQKWLKKKGF